MNVENKGEKVLWTSLFFLKKPQSPDANPDVKFKPKSLEVNLSLINVVSIEFKPRFSLHS